VIDVTVDPLAMPPLADRLQGLARGAEAVGGLLVPRRASEH
jgi:hypothetical protein